VTYRQPLNGNFVSRCRPSLQLDLWAVAEDVEAFSTVIARPTVAVKCAVASFSSEAVY